MKYSFNLINGENVDLTPLRINDNIFSLIDELNQNYLRFSIDSSNFAWNIDTENVKIINDDVFKSNQIRDVVSNLYAFINNIESGLLSKWNIS